MPRRVTPLVLLSWSLGLYAVVLGILQLSGWNSDGARLGRDIAEFFGRSASPLVVVFAIAEIVLGVVMALAPLGLLQPGASRLLLAAAAAFWLVRAFFALFVEVRPFHPEALVWLKNLAWYLVLALATWEVRRSVG